MAKNDAILVDGIVTEKSLDGSLPANKGEAFEYFCIGQILKNFDLAKEEIEAGWIDGRNDGGIDGLYIFVNGHHSTPKNPATLPRSSAYIEIYAISCKYHDTFKEATLNTLVASTQELFDFSLNENELKGAYSKSLLSLRDHLINIYYKTAISSPKVIIRFFYASRGDTAEIGESVVARSHQISNILSSFFSEAEAEFNFLGSREIIEKFRESRKFNLNLPFQDYLSGAGEGYILVAKLSDYFKFVSDEDGELRRYLFDSNVRDYLGENKVNDDIAASLEEDGAADFWWLNNGVTILATKAAINGKTMVMQDIQVVNGLQTTETLYRHFRTGTSVSSNRALAIKVIVSNDPSLRDQIIRATNNQSAVEQASLHATDKIQRDIEQILEKNEWFYERRRNYYRNIGKPEKRFVTPMYIAAGYVAIAIKNPANAAKLKSRFMRNEKSYENVFSDKTPIEFWPVMVSALKTAEEKMLQSVRSHPSQGERFLRNWRGMVALLFFAKQVGRFDFGLSELLSIHIDEKAIQTITLCWDFIQPYRKGSAQPNESQIKQMCTDFANVHSLSGVACVGVRSINDGKSAAIRHPKERPLPTSFIEQVNELLPPQPWPPGTHAEIADKLNCKRKKVSQAIQYLIDTGQRHTQHNGVIYDSNGNAI